MVKRWEITDSQGWQYCPEPRPDGRWVRYEDYAKLEAATVIVGEIAALVPLDEVLTVTKTGATLVQWLKERLASQADEWNRLEREKYQ